MEEENIPDSWEKIKKEGNILIVKTEDEVHIFKWEQGMPFKNNE